MTEQGFKRRTSLCLELRLTANDALISREHKLDMGPIKKPRASARAKSNSTFSTTDCITARCLTVHEPRGEDSNVKPLSFVLAQKQTHGSSY